MSKNTNFVPTIESTALPSTPAKEWAEKINGILDAHKPSTPFDARPPPIPGTGSEEATGIQPHPGAGERSAAPAGRTAKVDPKAAAYLASFDPDDLQPPRPPFATDDTGSVKSGLSNLSTEAQAGSLRHLGAGDSSSTLGAGAQSDAENLSTIVHTGTPGSPHPVAPLSRLVKSSERTGTPPTSFSTTVDSNQNKAPMSPLAGPDVLPPPAPRGDLSASAPTPDSPTPTPPISPNSNSRYPTDTTAPPPSEEPRTTRLPERAKGLPVVGKAKE
ncbi:hypothetical protein MVEN_00293100 [Mycena venus]|uniref:Uncharacterized protein n=1 Tax=Mycena venus TaxID=2733690 RepID=A0A8H6YZY6_9AGAR|nr:hypothetical protein MVEN_00293100 [Mycena venus]